MKHVTSEEQKNKILLMTTGKFFALPFILIIISSIVWGLFFTVSIQFRQNYYAWDGKGDASQARFVCNYMSRNHPYGKCNFFDLVTNYVKQTMMLILFLSIGFFVLPFSDLYLALLYIITLPLIFFLIYRWEQRKILYKQNISL